MRVHVDIQSQLGVLIALGQLQTVNLTQIAIAGHAHHAGTLVEQGVKLVHVHVGVADQVEDHSRVDVTGTAAHHQALKRGQTHGGLNRLAGDLSGSGSAVADVQNDSASRPSAGLPMTSGTTEEMYSWEVP